MPVGTLVSRCARLSTAADVRRQYRHCVAGVCVALIWCGPGTYSCASNCPLKAGITHIPKAATSSILSDQATDEAEFTKPPEPALCERGPGAPSSRRATAGTCMQMSPKIGARVLGGAPDDDESGLSTPLMRISEASSRAATDAAPAAARAAPPAVADAAPAAEPDAWCAETALSVEHAAVRARRAACLLYTSPSPRDRTRSRMPSSA